MIYKVNSKGKSIYDIIVDGVPFDGDPLPNPLLNSPIRRSLLKLKQKKKEKKPNYIIKTNKQTNKLLNIILFIN